MDCGPRVGMLWERLAGSRAEQSRQGNERAKEWGMSRKYKRLNLGEK